ncbi:MAG TPA: winged helix DNA-binding domain-containing protein [Thermoleophilaceae bacterium]
MERTLSARELGRATLARQMLLQRERVTAPDAVERLVALQAQVREPPFVGLWTRIEDFRRAELVEAIERREVVRATAIRCTMHLMSARDFLAFWGAIQPAVARAVRAWTGKRLGGLDMDRIAAAVRERVAERPSTFAELRASIPELAQAESPQAAAYAVRAHLPLVQVPDGGSTGHSNAAPYGLAEHVLGAPAAREPATAELVRRYLAAFGPASVADAQAWAGLTGLKPVFEDLRAELAVFRDESGGELFDLPDAPRPDPGTPAPARLLPDYDNLVLAYRDRSRFVPEEHRKAIFRPAGVVRATFLVDGVVAGTWSRDRDGSVALEPFGRIAKRDRIALDEEVERMREWAGSAPAL